jgi:hypothetical protein
MTEVKISWTAFQEFGREVKSLEFNLDLSPLEPKQFLEALFEATNIYGGKLWDYLEPMLPAGRSHTALSVGDRVSLDGVTYKCEAVGWEIL